MHENTTEKYFRHTDGGLYRFIGYARSADTTNDVVIYEHLWPFDQGWWVRDRIEFETRFSPIDEITVRREMKQDRVAAQEQVNAAKTARRAAS